jgi:hypothetical protein
MKKTVQPTIINIDRDKLSLCAPYHLEPLSVQFTPEMISDLEIVGKQELNTALRNFIDQNKIKPGQLVIIVSQGVYFEKNYNGPNPPTPEEVDSFIETIPFTTVSSKLFRVISGFKQVVINREYYEILKETFEQMGFQVIAVVPGFALGQNAIAGFSAETCRVIYKKIDQIIADSMIGAKDNMIPSLHEKEQVMLESHKPLVIGLVVLILLVCGGALYFTFGRPPVTKPVVRSIPQIPVAPSREPTPSPVPEMTFISPEASENLTAQILNASGKIGQAASMSALLKSIGLENIQTGNSSKIFTTTLLQLSSKVSTPAGDLILKSVQTLYPAATKETDPEAKFDVVVTIGTNTP